MEGTSIFGSLIRDGIGFCGPLRTCGQIRSRFTFQSWFQSKKENKNQRRVKKTMSIITLDLTDNLLMHIKSWKWPIEVWKTFCNFHELKSLSNLFFICHKFSMCKKQENDDLLHHIIKIKSLPDLLTCLEVPVENADVVMNLFENLPPSYKHLIDALETMPMQELTMECVTSCLVHKISKKMENKLQGDDVAIVWCQDK